MRAQYLVKNKFFEDSLRVIGDARSVIDSETERLLGFFDQNEAELTKIPLDQWSPSSLRALGQVEYKYDLFEALIRSWWLRVDPDQRVVTMPPQYSRLKVRPYLSFQVRGLYDSTSDIDQMFDVFVRAMATYWGTHSFEFMIKVPPSDADDFGESFTVTADPSGSAISYCARSPVDFNDVTDSDEKMSRLLQGKAKRRLT